MCGCVFFDCLRYADSAVTISLHVSLQIGQTALKFASTYGHVEVVEILSKGAQVDLQNKVNGGGGGG